MGLFQRQNSHRLINDMNRARNFCLYLLIATLATVVASCHGSASASLRFEITNKTGKGIDSLIILPNRNLDRISISPNATVEYFCDMTGGAKVDGQYRLTFKSDSELTIKHFGYFTNGYPIEKLIKIIVEPDTVKFDFVL